MLESPIEEVGKDAHDILKRVRNDLERLNSEFTLTAMMSPLAVADEVIKAMAAAFPFPMFDGADPEFPKKVKESMDKLSRLLGIIQVAARKDLRGIPIPDWLPKLGTGNQTRTASRH